MTLVSVGNFLSPHVSAEAIMTQDSHLQMVIIVVCVVTGCVLILLMGLLVFKLQRKTGELISETVKEGEDAPKKN